MVSGIVPEQMLAPRLNSSVVFVFSKEIAPENQYQKI
jgi:hypothetical protein